MRLQIIPSAATRLAALVLCALTLAACGEAPKPQQPRAEAEAEREPRLLLARVAFADLPGWRGDRMAAALPALKRSCARLTRRGDDAPVGPEGRAGTVADWRAPCRALADLPAGDSAALRAALERHFVPFAAESRDGPEGLFTGYYEASLEAARERRGPYQHPIYARPDDLVTADVARFRADLKATRIVGRVQDQRLVPYYTRAEIWDGAFQGREELPLFYADDPVDVFFLHVQGSGVVNLPDGSRQRVGYAANNGHEFFAIGRALIRSGEMDGADMSMQGIRDWLRANPSKADALMRRNPRFIFFRKIDGPGPIGAQGVALTAGRSLAVDPAFMPLGAPVFLDTTDPVTREPLQRLMVAQDTGSAIKGPVRGDFFWGSGEPALAKAGRMKQQGRYYLLLPASVAERRAGS
jgi:membrane-bound lytic murein transglycosylase A